MLTSLTIQATLLLPQVQSGPEIYPFPPRTPNLAPVPETTANELDQGLERRAALASTLLAGLELEREGSVALAQDKPFGRIRVAAIPSSIA
jgi:hypothetical protein